MALFLVESALPSGTDQPQVQAMLGRLASAARERAGELIEAQVASDFSRLFAIIEAEAREAATAATQAAQLDLVQVKEVRLVGQSLDEVKASRKSVDYVVEWNFPPGLTMERYLQRKAANSPKYALVPEVTFLRTYVCEDMSKCLCFYDADSESDVLRARQAVEAPVDAVTRVQPVE